MRREWKWMLMPAALLLLAVATSPAQSVGDTSRDLLDLRVGQAEPDGVEITLAAVGDATYETLVLDAPDRLVVDLHGVVSRLDQYKYEVDRDGVLRVRAARPFMQYVDKSGRDVEDYCVVGLRCNSSTAL